MTAVPENFNNLSWSLVNIVGPLAGGIVLALSIKSLTRGIILGLGLMVICSIVLWSSGFDVLALGVTIRNTCGGWQNILPSKISDSLILPVAVATMIIGFALGLLLDRLTLSKNRAA